MEIYQVHRTSKYPDGVKYGLILVDLRTGRRVLMDNHHPKGPHIHVNEAEMVYVYSDEEKLVNDFRALVFENMGVRI